MRMLRGSAAWLPVICAGVWEFITSKEAIDLIGDCETPEEACRVVSKQTRVNAVLLISL